ETFWKNRSRTKLTVDQPSTWRRGPCSGDASMKPALIYYVTASLDGYIARPDGRVDWLQPIEEAGEEHGYHQFYEGVDGVVVGRVIYESIHKDADTWPYPGKTCIVLTRNALSAADPEVPICHWTPAQALDRLGKLGCKRVWLVGGGSR